MLAAEAWPAGMNRNLLRELRAFAVKNHAHPRALTHP